MRAALPSNIDLNAYDSIVYYYPAEVGGWFGHGGDRVVLGVGGRGRGDVHSGRDTRFRAGWRRVGLSVVSGECGRSRIELVASHIFERFTPPEWFHCHYPITTPSRPRHRSPSPPEEHFVESAAGLTRPASS